MTCTVTGWPTVSTSAGRTPRSKLISDAGSNPSMPPTSTNAPKSLSAVTTPGSTAPTTSLPRVSTARTCASSSSNARRDSTTLVPRRSSSCFVMRNSNRRPTYSAGSATGLASSCESGQKARTPATSTSNPPLLTAVITPSTGRPVAAASARLLRPAPAPRPAPRRSMKNPCRSPIATTRASSVSPSLATIASGGVKQLQRL